MKIFILMTYAIDLATKTRKDVSRLDESNTALNDFAKNNAVVCSK